MKFRTELNVTNFPFSLSFKDSLCFLGSCFSENISAKFSNLGFDTLANPHGVLYGSPALLENLRRAVLQEKPADNELIHTGSSWVHLFGHSELNAPSKEQLLENIAAADAQLRDQLLKAKVCFVTLGSAWVYRHLETGLLVGNCHKIPQKQFDRFIQNTQEVKVYLERMMTLLSELNPKLQVVFTVSPVKHIRDGISENSLSKATLLVAIHEAIKSAKNAFYFPAYELVNEDLRDYRFYTEDLAHPNEMAINYIWEKLGSVVFDKNQLALNLRIEKLRSAMNHRPFDPNSEESLAFSTKLKVQLDELFAETGIRL